MNILYRLQALLITIAAALIIAPQFAEAGTIIHDRTGSERQTYIDGDWNDLTFQQQYDLIIANTGCRDYSTTLGQYVPDPCRYIEYNQPDPDNPGEEGTDVGEDTSRKKTYADLLFAASTTGNSCISCDFLSYFMLSLTAFSGAVYAYLIAGFKLLAPVMIAIWIGYRVSKLMVMGGEDGKQFIYNFIQKMALFFVVWLIATTTLTSGNRNVGIEETPFMWRTLGPTYLEASFGLSTDLRDAAMQSANSTSLSSQQGDPTMGCADATTSVPDLRSDLAMPAAAFIPGATQIGCFTERVHMIGMASGLAVVYTAFTGAGMPDAKWLERIAVGVVFGAVKVAAGLFMMTVFAISAVWLIFLILDVVTRGLITAAFSPVLALMFLFQPTRGFAVKAIKALGGAVFTAVALSLVSVLGYFLITNTILVYNSVLPSVQSSYEGFQVLPIPVGDQNGSMTLLQRYGEFIRRIQETSPQDNPYVPMDFSSPWFWYLCMSGVAIFALGKKLIAMLEGIVDYQGASAFADNALKVTGAAAKAGVAGGGLALLAGQGTAKMTAGPALGLGAAGLGAAGLGGTALGQKASAMRANWKETRNIFGNMKNPAGMAPGGGGGLGLETGIRKSTEAISDVAQSGDTSGGA